MTQRKRIKKYGLLACLILGFVCSGTEWKARAAGKDLELVDMSKGVTYHYNASGTPDFINLNGNSVVIKKVDDTYCNIYIDANRNGIVDAGETKVVMDNYTGGTDNSDIPSSIPVYGVYEQKSTVPIRITLEEGGIQGVVCGVYGGELVTEETAVTIAITDAKNVGACYGANKGSVVSDVDIVVNGGSVSACFGAYENSTAESVTIAVRDSKTSTCQGANGSTVGSVKLVFNNAASTAYGVYTSTASEIMIEVDGEDTGGNMMGSVWGAYGGSTVNAKKGQKAAITINHNSGVIQGNCTAAESSTVTTAQGVPTAIDININDGWVGNCYGAYQTSVTMADETEVAVDIEMSGDAYAKGAVYGAYNMASTTEMGIVGDILVHLESTARKSSGQNYAEATAVYGGMTVDGSVALQTNHAATNRVTLLSGGGVVTGYAILTVGEDTSINNIVVSSGYSIEKDVTVDIYGSDVSNNNTYFNGLSGKATGYEYAVSGDYNLTVRGGRFSTLYAMQSSSASNISGNVTISVLSGTISSAFYGAQSCKIDGDYKLTTGETTVFAGGYIYGAYSAVVNGSCVIDIYNNNPVNTSYNYGNISGAIGCTFNKGASISIHNGFVGNCYGIQGSGSVQGNLEVMMENITVNSGYLYGVNAMTVNGDTKVVMHNIKRNGTSSLMGGCIYNGSYGGNVTLETEGLEPGSNTYYGLYGCSIKDNLKVSETDNHMAGSYYVINNSMILGTTNLVMQGGSYESSCYIYQGGSSASGGDITVKCSDIKFGKEGNTYTSAIETRLTIGTQQLTMDMDSCEFLSAYQIESGTTGNVRIRNGKDYYYSGSYPITENLVADNLYTNYGSSLRIPKGITVSVAEAGEIRAKSGSRFLIEGTLKGKISEEVNSYDKASYFIYGGSLESETEVERLYYPITFNYMKKGGTISTGGVDTHPALPEQPFGCVGTVSVKCVPKKGYAFVSATVKTESSSQEENLTQSDTDNQTYSFDMPKESADINIIFTGTPIVLGKTVADPVAKLNEETTAENPLYDMADISISNDGKEGTVSYALDEVSGLPEGLVFEEGKIYGIPTTAYEEGKKTIIHVTGKNDTTADLVLNIVVTEGDKGQSGQEGRINIDEENKVIHLLGNSAVIKETGTGTTGIYLDDNRDGEADRDVPVYENDLSEYTIYGVKDVDLRKPLKITMQSGTVGALYGVVDAMLTSTHADAVDIRIMNGTIVNSVTAIDNSATVAGTVALIIDSEATCKSSKLSSGNSVCTGSFYNNKGTLQIEGIYTLQESVEVDSLSIGQSADFTIPTEKKITDIGVLTVQASAKVTNEGTLSCGNVTAASNNTIFNDGTFACEKITLNANAVMHNNGEFSCTGAVLNYATSTLYNRGHFSCTGTMFTNYGKLVMCGGDIEQKENTWANVYYRVTFDTDYPNTTVSSKAFYTMKENDVTHYYASGGSTLEVTATNITGYDRYFAINDGDDTESENGSFSFEMPRKETVIKVSYVPSDIAVSKRYADPVGVVGTLYTEEEPLYDFDSLIVVNDTVAPHGGEKRYKLKNGYTLPEGLTITNGKLVGTPKVVEETGKEIVVTVTGRNGTTADISLVIVIRENYIQADINEIATISNYVIDLHGHSAVIREAEKDTTKTSIYLDDNRDGIADNSIALKVNGKTEIDLSNYTVLGCQYNAKETYSGDITIHMYGGKLKALHGAYGASASSKVVVEGNVAVYIEGGAISNNVSAGYYAAAESLKLDITGGTFNNKIWGAYYPQNVSQVSFSFRDKASLKAVNINSNAILYVTEGGTVTGDIYAEVGVEQDTYGIGGSTSFTQSFMGVYSTAVLGDVEYTLDGYWYGRTANYFVSHSTVNGDVNVDWKSGYLYGGVNNSNNRAFVRESNVQNVNVLVEEDADATGTFNVAVGGTAKNLYFYAAESAKTNISITMMTTSIAPTITGWAYADNEGSIDIATGDYIIEEVLEAKKLTIGQNANVTIAEGATVTNTSTSAINGKVNNKGTWNCKGNTTLNNMIENEGSLSNFATLTIASNGILINREGGTFTIEDVISSSGAIVNYGALKQTYKASNVGTIYTTNIPQMANALSNYNNMYFPVILDYPEYCMETATITNNYGIAPKALELEGDTNQYMRGGDTFKITAGDVTEGIALEKITFNNSGKNSPASTADQKTWTGTLGWEPTTFTFEFKNLGDEQIILSKDSDTISGLRVGQYYDSYNLVNEIAISGDNDSITGASVKYVLDNETPLPAGLRLSNGRIYGTPTKASNQPQEVNITVIGKNQSRAIFTLTIDGIAKGTPTLCLPTNLKAKAGESLESITIPPVVGSDNIAGTFQWKDGTGTVGNEVGDKEFDVIFTPANTEDYDWSLIKNGTYDNATKTVAAKITVAVGKIDPEYTLPEEVSAIYGQTLGDVELPQDENGGFVWVDDASLSVGEVGTKTFKVNYVPTNTELYNMVKNLSVKVVVNKAEAVCPELGEISAAYGDTLGDVELPIVENGRWEWITISTTPIQKDEIYKVIFKPDDLKNYSWETVNGYSSARKGIILEVSVILRKRVIDISALPVDITVDLGKALSETILPHVKDGEWYLGDELIEEPAFSAVGLPDGAFEWTDGSIVVDSVINKEFYVNYVPEDGEKYETKKDILVSVLINHLHDYEEEWSKDEDNHWKECECGKVTEKAAHEWDKGNITKAPTTTVAGEKTYTCTICGATKVEKVPATGEESHEHKYGEWQNDATNHWKQCECGEVVEKAAHKWDAGKITKEPTAVTAGEKTFICTVCSVTKKETVAATGQTTPGGMTPGGTTPEDLEDPDDPDGEGLEVGTVLTDNVTKATYEVTENDGEERTVTYVKSTNKNASTISIPSTVTLDGLSYDVTKIANNAFKNNKTLKKVVISSKVLVIGDGAFYGCKKLSTVSLGANVTTIGKNAFYNCIALKKIVIPSKVNKIGSKAFYGCKKLLSITIKSATLTTKNVGSKAFTKAGSSNYKKMTVKVPKKQLKAYKTMLKKRGLSSNAKVKK